MEKLIQSELETNLVLTRENLLNRLEILFKDKAVEAHVFGSVARQQADAFSDIDIWFTFKDEDFDETYRKRFEYYANLGDIVHFCEAPQNAPINGVHTALLIRSQNGVISVADIYLCPFSTAYITDGGKKLFGIDLPVGIIGFNPKKVIVDKNYRIDFFICFIFNAIKEIARHESDPFDDVLREYEYLYKNYQISVDPLDNREHNFSMLKQIIRNIEKVVNEKQQKTLNVISDFIEKVETN